MKGIFACGLFLLLCLAASPGALGQTVTKTVTKTVSKTIAKTTIAKTTIIKTIARSTIARTTITKTGPRTTFTTTKTISKTLSAATVTRTLPQATTTQKTTVIQTTTLTQPAQISTTTATTTVTATSTSPVACPTPSNFVQDPGFESGSLSSWTKTSNGGGAPPGSDTGVRCDNNPDWHDAGACGWFATFPAGATTQQGIGISQKFKPCVGPGQKYHFSISYKVTRGCQLQWQAGTQTGIGGMGVLPDTGAPAAWVGAGLVIEYEASVLRFEDVFLIFTASGTGGQACGVSVDSVKFGSVLS